MPKFPKTVLHTLHRLTDRTIQSPIKVQFIVLAMVMVLITLAGTLLAGLTLALDTWGDAFWWTFTRMTDPGYLGDDKGIWERALSTAITTVGWVAFGGILISIVTNATQERLETIKAGRAEIRGSDHTVILGWNGTVFSVLEHLAAT